MSTVLLVQISKQTTELQQALDCLTNTPADLSQQLLAQHTAKLNHIKSSIGTLESQAKHEMTAAKREKAQERVKAFLQDFHALKLQLASLTLLHQQSQRHELIPQSIHHRHHQDAPSTILQIDQLDRESNVLDNSNTHIDEFIQIGTNALNELYEQRSILKRTQRRLLDVANSLGLGSTVIRLIEHRTTQDKYMLYGGMLITLIGIGLIIYLFK